MIIVIFLFSFQYSLGFFITHSSYVIMELVFILGLCIFNLFLDCLNSPFHCILVASLTGAVLYNSCFVFK